MSNPIPDGGWKKVDGEWFVRPPGSPVSAGLGNHEVTEHDDGTITVNPSILYEIESLGYHYHGFLEHGVWRSV